MGRPKKNVDVTPVEATNEVVETAVETVVEEPVEEKAPAIYGVVSNCSSLRVRSEASTNGSVISIVPEGTKLEIVGDSNGFYKVILPNKMEGYCMKSYVQ